MNVLRRLSPILLLASLVSGMAVLKSIAIVHAATTALPDCPTYTQLTSAVTAAASGDTLTLGCTTGADTISFPVNGQIEISKNLTLDSSGSPNFIVLTGLTATRLFFVDSGKSLTLKGAAQKPLDLFNGATTPCRPRLPARTSTTRLFWAAPSMSPEARS